MPRAGRRRAGRAWAALAALLLPAALVPADASASAAVALPAATVLPAAPPDAVAGDWAWPVGAPIRVLEPFRRPATRYSAGHRGIDVAATAGDPVMAAGTGVVHFAGAVAGRDVVSIDHGDGVISAIEPVTAVVAEGDVVRRGEPIGAVSAGGHCTGTCVHFGVRVDGEYVSPFLYLGGVPRAVLLPLAG
ncbi:peptidoglycan DD-metalloendopeptidase family protein [Agromyces sp. CFH 90414]|uniref:Peptidoglycan DD-metalloendopeptidase family protein n=2 Tax=Agromyces agglutinans TaxID=2662258 RepID=A0A6I2F7D6_9MICO|nr:peptidoglycan DD-metalloendopeptidase family protein [Agromyces agglutinans]